MAGASTLDPDNLPEIAHGGNATRTGGTTGTLGPSDSTDSGSDVTGRSALPPEELLSDSDAAGTGDRAGPGMPDEVGDDIGFDQAVSAEGAGLGTGPDEAELARDRTQDRTKDRTKDRK